MSEEVAQATQETAAPAEQPALQASAPEAPAAQTEDVGLSATGEQTESVSEEEVKPTAPDEYQDFVDEKGVAFSAKEMPEFTAMAKELGLSQEKANQLLMTMVPTVRGKLASSLAAVKESWKKSALNDEEYGGAEFKSNMKVANSAYSKYVSPELQKLMQQSGLSTHPDFIRMFYRIGKSMSEDTGVTGQGSPQPKRRMFPNSNMAI